MRGLWRKVGAKAREKGCAVIDSIASIDYIAVMATITIRNLPEETKRRLRMRAAENGRSMEQEARLALVQNLMSGNNSSTATAKKSWVIEIMDIYRQAGGNDEMQIPPRQIAEPPPDFSGPDFDP